MCLKHIRLSLPGTNALGQAYVCSFLQRVCCTLCNYTGFFMASGNLQEKEFYSFKQFSCILRKIIISTSPWQPGSKNRKDCPILHIYQKIKGCYCKLFLEHSGLNLNLCNSNKFTNSVCLSKGWTFIFFKGSEKISGRYLAVNGMSMQVGGGTCKGKGNLLIKQSTFAECREGVQKYLGVCSPSHHPSWFMQLEIHKTACSYNFS